MFLPGYSDSKAVENLNNDLAEKLGNLLHRISSRKINMNVGDVFPALNQEVLEIKFSEEDIKMYRSLQKLPGNDSTILYELLLTCQFVYP